MARLQIPIHTCPMIRCVIRVSQEGNWSPDLAMITATKPVAGSSWRAESPITESGEAWYDARKITKNTRTHTRARRQRPCLPARLFDS